MIKSPAELLRWLDDVGIIVTLREPDRIHLDGPAGWQSAELLAELREHKPALLELLRERVNGSLAKATCLPAAADPDDFGQPAGELWQPDGPVDPKPRVCRLCPSADWTDTPIHEGRSIRRDCARCGAFIGFPLWYGRPGVTCTPVSGSRNGLRHIAVACDTSAAASLRNLGGGASVAMSQSRSSDHETDPG